MAKASEAPVEAPKKGEHWVKLDGGEACRLMCDPVEGYVMARYKGCMPWVLNVKDLVKTFKRVEK